MKNIIKITFFAFLLISLGSCSNDKDPVTSLNGFEFRDVSEVPSPAVLLKANDAEIYKELEWDRADYGVSTAATYTIVATDHDSDPDFLYPVEEPATKYDANPDARKAIYTVKDFNDLISKLKTFKCTEMNIDIRIKSTIGVSGNKQVQYTAPKTFAVTGYPTSKLILAFVKDSQSPTDAPKILSSSYDKVNDFEGYMYLEPGDYKLYRPDACGGFSSPVVYGGSGGILEEGSAAPSINVATAGHYLVTADLTSGALKYKIQYYKAFGIFGAGMKGSTVGSANAVPMSDDTNSNVWKITFDLFKGKKFRFKSNDWIGDLTGNPLAVPPGATTKIISTLGSTSSGTLVSVTGTNGEITVPGTDDGTRQKYEIVVDVSKPRNYTYTLTIK